MFARRSHRSGLGGGGGKDYDRPASFASSLSFSRPLLCRTAPQAIVVAALIGLVLLFALLKSSLLSASAPPTSAVNATTLSRDHAAHLIRTTRIAATRRSPPSHHVVVPHTVPYDAMLKFEEEERRLEALGETHKVRAPSLSDGSQRESSVCVVTHAAVSLNDTQGSVAVLSILISSLFSGYLSMTAAERSMASNTHLFIHTSGDVDVLSKLVAKEVHRAPALSGKITILPSARGSASRSASEGLPGTTKGSQLYRFSKNALLSILESNATCDYILMTSGASFFSKDVSKWRLPLPSKATRPSVYSLRHRRCDNGHMVVSPKAYTDLEGRQRISVSGILMPVALILQRQWTLREGQFMHVEGLPPLGQAGTSSTLSCDASTMMSWVQSEALNFAQGNGMPVVSQSDPNGLIQGGLLVENSLLEGASQSYDRMSTRQAAVKCNATSNYREGEFGGLGWEEDEEEFFNATTQVFRMKLRVDFNTRPPSIAVVVRTTMRRDRWTLAATLLSLMSSYRHATGGGGGGGGGSMPLLHIAVVLADLSEAPAGEDWAAEVVSNITQDFLLQDGGEISLRHLRFQDMVLYHQTLKNTTPQAELPPEPFLLKNDKWMEWKRNDAEGLYLTDVVLFTIDPFRFADYVLVSNGDNYYTSDYFDTVLPLLDTCISPQELIGVNFAKRSGKLEEYRAFFWWEYVEVGASMIAGYQYRNISFTGGLLDAGAVIGTNAFAGLLVVLSRDYLSNDVKHIEERILYIHQ